MWRSTGPFKVDRCPLLDRPDDAPLFLRPSGAVTTRDFLQQAHALAAALPASRYVLNACRDRFRFALTVAAALIGDRVSLLCGDPSPPVLAALLERYPDTAVVDDDHPSVGPGRGVNPALPADRLAAIVFTSGSTGAPVAHEKRWGALVARSRAAGERFALDEAAPAAVIGTVPPGHMYGFETTVLLPLHAACASWCGPAFFPADVSAALCATAAPHLLVTTPLQLRSLAALPGPYPGRCISATAPLDAALAASLETAWSAELHEIFGATEVGSIATRRTAREEGWRPYPGVSLRQTADAALVEAVGAPPFPLADEIQLQADGTFRLLGRRTDLVKLGGRRASLAGLNRILTELQGVCDGVFVVPDDLESRSTARLEAVVVAPGRSRAELMAELRDRIDPVFLPRRLVRVDALPRNSLGKLPRQAVLDLLARATPPPP